MFYAALLILPFILPSVAWGDETGTPVRGDLSWQSTGAGGTCPTTCQNSGLQPVTAGQNTQSGDIYYYVCRARNAGGEGDRVGVTYRHSDECNFSYNGLPASSTEMDCQCQDPSLEQVEEPDLGLVPFYEWVPSTGNCGIACYNAPGSMRAVQSGAYTATGTPFYVCRGTGHYIGGQSGFNLAPSWQNGCYASIATQNGTQATVLSPFECQCQSLFTQN